jgi:hypothetical protein
MDFVNRLIHSPKIVFGMDSLIQRPVFAVMGEKTISARQMLQQVCRSRNIVSLSFFFEKKRVTEAKYGTLADCRAAMTRHGEMLEMRSTVSQDDYIAWFDAYCVAVYNADACGVNKFASFLHLLGGPGQRGFVVTVSHTPGHRALVVPKLQRRASDFANFDIKRYKRMQHFLKLCEPTVTTRQDARSPAELIEQADAMETGEAERGEEVTTWSEQDIEDKRFRLEMVENMRRLAGLRGPVKQAEQRAKNAEHQLLTDKAEGQWG